MRAMDVIAFPGHAGRPPRTARACQRAGDAAIVDLAAYREVIAGGDGRWEVRAGAVIDALEDLLASRNRVEVAEFCARAVRLLEDNAAAIGDDPAVRRLAARLGAVRDRALRVAR